MQSVLEAIPGVETAREEFRLGVMSAGFADRVDAVLRAAVCSIASIALV